MLLSLLAPSTPIITQIVVRVKGVMAAVRDWSGGKVLTLGGEIARMATGNLELGSFGDYGHAVEISLAGDTFAAEETGPQNFVTPIRAAAELELQSSWCDRPG